jgi:hypothetical protein
MGLIRVVPSKIQDSADKVMSRCRSSLGVLQQCVRLVLRRQTCGRHVYESRNAGDDIVEVVGHAGGQMPEGLHALGLMQLRPQSFCLRGCVHNIRDVAYNTNDPIGLTMNVVMPAPLRLNVPDRAVW